MLYISLILSVIFLAVANYSARQPQRPISPAIVCGLCCVVLPLGPGMFLPPVAIQVLVVFLAFILWKPTARSPGFFHVLSLSATVVVYGGIYWAFVLPGERKLERLRERFAYESMEERLPAPASRLTATQLTSGAAERLTLLETSVEEDYRFRSRAILLRRLHEDKVRSFVNNPNFGVARMVPLSESWINSGLRPDESIPEPDSLLYSPSPTGDAGWEPVVLERTPLDDLHREGIVDFINAIGFGYVKDRRHVAGFESHRFSSVPGPKETWEVRRLELVGLLLHDSPIVYLSRNLPRMDQVRETPTRLLDSFEAAGLETLRGGEDLFFGSASGTVRMLGALRATKQCVECHGGERGDLLGAFSYTLRRGER